MGDSQKTMGLSGPTDAGRAILERVLAARERVWFVCPYVTSEALVVSVRGCASPSKRLLTRYNGSDLVTGATDLGVVAALVEAGVELRVLEDVHAKVYVIDDWAYVGSANLTNHGLAASLREFGGASATSGHVLEAVAYIDRVWRGAAALPSHVLASTLARLEAMHPGLEAARERRGQTAKDLTVGWSAPCAPVEPIPTLHRSTPGKPIGPQPSLVGALVDGQAVLDFHDVEPGSAHNRFMNWRRKHQNSFYLTIKSKLRGNLHATSCKHQGNYDLGEYPGSATRDRKICADTPEFLYDWAKAHSITIHRCGTCKPPGANDGE